MKTRRLAILLIFLVFFAGVPNKLRAQDAESNAAELTPIIVEDLDASGEIVHYSLRENRIIPEEELTDENWDISFKGTSILVNFEAQLVDRSFDYVASARKSGYAYDDETDGPAIPSGNGAGWFDYDPATHFISTVPERTIVVITPVDTYAKIEILSYYKSQSSDLEEPRFYTFRFVHQANGTRKFHDHSHALIRTFSGSYRARQLVLTGFTLHCPHFVLNSVPRCRFRFLRVCNKYDAHQRRLRRTKRLSLSGLRFCVVIRRR